MNPHGDRFSRLFNPDDTPLRITVNYNKKGQSRVRIDETLSAPNDEYYFRMTKNRAFLSAYLYLRLFLEGHGISISHSAKGYVDIVKKIRIQFNPQRQADGIAYRFELIKDARLKADYDYSSYHESIQTASDLYKLYDEIVALSMKLKKKKIRIIVRPSKYISIRCSGCKKEIQVNKYHPHDVIQ